MAGLAAALLVVVPARGQDLNTLLTNFLVDLRNGTWGIRTPITSVAMADGTSGAPSYTFASEPTLGFWRSGSTVIEAKGGLNVTSTLTSGARFGLNGTTNTRFVSGGNGLFSVGNAAETIGAEIKVDALPTISSGCGTSPSVFAGSTPMAGGVNIGTGGVATTCVIAFNGTAFPSAPFCVANNVTSNTVTRILSSTTTLTFNTTTAWSSGEIVAYLCIGAK